MNDPTTLPLIIEPEQLSSCLKRDDLLILDLSKQENYKQAHLSGAIHLPFQALLAGTPPAPGKLPDSDKLNQLFSELGLTANRHVIAYDDEGGGWAGRLIWTLDVIGHQRYSYLNGGIHAWVSAGLPVSTLATNPIPSTGHWPINREPIANKDTILQRLDADDFIIWDARSAEEYRGERKISARCGHIPGASNYEWTRGMDRQHNLRIRPLEEIRAELANLGISADKDIVTHCQTHHRSGFTYLLGKALGFERIRAYPGSWSEWGNDADTPIEQEA